jgi:catechol 2,3-dioxygenase-like lactoylglutathione lyase family enzyme
MAEKLMEPKLESVQPVLMSRDVLASIQFYEKLGFRLAGQDAPDNPKYARLRRDNVELHLQWHDAKEWDYPNDRPSYRFVVVDVDGLYEQFRETGALADATSISETPWGTREFHVRDPDLNLLQFYRWL